MQVTDEMLAAAMKVAVTHGIAPKHADTETYMKHWVGMKACLQAAIDASEDACKSPG